MNRPPPVQDVHDAPVTTGAFGVSGQKDVPDVSDTYGLPNVSRATDAHDADTIQSTPTVLDAPDVPDVSDGDDTNDVPGPTGMLVTFDVAERDAELAKWINTISSDPAMPGMVAKMLRDISAARGLDLGSIESIVEDVISDLIVLTWRKREEWGTFSEDRRRGWMFRSAQNLTRQACDRAHRDRRDEAHAVQQARFELLAADEAPRGDRQVLAAIGQRVAATPGMGVSGWDAVQDAALRSKRVRAAFRQIREDIEAGRPWSVRTLVSPILRWEDWAAERRHRSLNLSTATAVADGAFHSPAEAQRNLVVWWILRRHPALGAPNATQIVEAGLVDHIVARRRHAAAVAVALGLSAREPRRAVRRT